jgi:predicted metal-dependent phosphoesterase TrpH
LIIKVDLHVHTSCSLDSLIPVDDLIETCIYKEIDCVAVTDHDEIECAVKLHEIEPSRIIVGEEIHTTAGEIIGLFIKDRIAPGLTPIETADKIKEQGGLVYIPHPFDNMRASIIKKQSLEEILPKVDIIEVYNSRNVFTWSNHKALNFAQKNNILAGVGSDAHSKFEVGQAHLLIEEFTSAEDFLSKLADAEYRKNKTPMIFNLVNKVYKMARSAKRKIYTH